MSASPRRRWRLQGLGGLDAAPGPAGVQAEPAGRPFGSPCSACSASCRCAGPGSPCPPHSAQNSWLSAAVAAATPAIASRSITASGIVSVSHVGVSSVSSTGRPSSSAATTSAVRMSACQSAHLAAVALGSSCWPCGRSPSSSRLGHPPAFVHDHRGERLSRRGREPLVAPSVVAVGVEPCSSPWRARCPSCRSSPPGTPTRSPPSTRSRARSSRRPVARRPSRARGDGAASP